MPRAAARSRRPEVPIRTASRSLIAAHDGQSATVRQSPGKTDVEVRQLQGLSVLSARRAPPAAAFKGRRRHRQRTQADQIGACRNQPNRAVWRRDPPWRVPPCRAAGGTPVTMARSFRLLDNGTTPSPTQAEALTRSQARKRDTPVRRPGEVVVGAVVHTHHGERFAHPAASAAVCFDRLHRLAAGAVHLIQGRSPLAMRCSMSSRQGITSAMLSTT